jgi:quercetin dioxygenase-like cupin family protein
MMREAWYEEAVVNLSDLVDRLESGTVEATDIDGQSILSIGVYETERSQAELYLLRPGQKIPAHEHSEIDDVFLGVRGQGRIRIWDAAGGHVDHAVKAGVVVVVQPGTPHEVSSLEGDFVYVLTQGPRERYDIHRYEPFQDSGDSAKRPPGE